jgi:Tol biopolymer transport system component
MIAGGQKMKKLMILITLLCLALGACSTPKTSPTPTAASLPQAGIGTPTASILTPTVVVPSPSLAPTAYDYADVLPVWSPDGKQIAFISNRDGESHYYLMNADGSGVRQLSDLLADPYPVLQTLSWSPDGKQLVLIDVGPWDSTGNVKSPDHLYLINTDGTGLLQLAPNIDNFSFDLSPWWSSWSPDGKHIFLTGNPIENQGGLGLIILANTDGSPASEPISGDQASWSPDGQWFIYNTSYNADNPGKTIIQSMDGGEPLSLMPENGWFKVLNWSPDGKYIAFACGFEPGAEAELCVTGADGSHLQHTTLPDGIDYLLDWSPDSQKIALISAKGELQTVGADGSNLQRYDLPDGIDTEKGVEWSPDSQRLVFQSESGKLQSINADGSGWMQFPENLQLDKTHYWSPDGKHLFFEEFGEKKIYVAEASGAQPPVVLDGEEAAWSPDGSQIVYQSGDEGIEGIYLANADGSNPHILSYKLTHVTPTPMPVPASQVIPELGTTLECTPGEIKEPRAIEDLLASLSPALAEMDSYQYHTIYRYKDGDAYPQDDLAIEVYGAHSSLLSQAGSTDSFPLASQAYRRSHIIQTDLLTKAKTEAVLTEDGQWIRQGDEAGWAALDVDPSTEMWNLADHFSPQAALMGQYAWASQFIYTKQEDGTISGPLMARPETIDGKEVMHYCWTPLPYDPGSDINGGFRNFEDAYTTLNAVQVHLWTSENDTRLVRFAMAGKHPSEYTYTDSVDHNPPRDFLMWVELSGVDQPVTIEAPAESQVDLTIPASPSPAGQTPAPINEFPLPQGARHIGAMNETQPVRLTPREYWELTSSLNSYLSQNYLSSGWSDVPAERQPVYETDESLMGSMAFYIQAMGQRGWDLKGKFIQLGWPAVYLFFERDGVRLPIFLEEGTDGSTRISAVLPPDEQALAAIRTGWTSYTNSNSDLPGDAVKAIDFDSRGRAWINTSAGVSVFDGKSWTSYSSEEIGFESDRNSVLASPLVVDSRDRVWIGSWGELAVLDGKTWKVYSTPYAKELDASSNNRITALAADPKGTVWLGLADGSVASFDGETWTRYAEGDSGLESFHEVKSMAFDGQGHLWMGNDGGGMYVFDGETWKTARKPDTERNTSSWETAEDLAIDRNGMVWTASWGGLSVYDGKTWTSYTPQNSGLPFDHLKALAVDEADRIWVGGLYGELAMFDPDGESIPYTPLNTDENSFSMSALSIDPQGRIWVGLDTGLRVFTPPK